MLTGGDRRSIGRVDEVLAAVHHDPALFAVLITGMTHADFLIRMRASDAVEKFTIDRPESLAPHKEALLGPIAAQEQQEVRWHVAQILPRLPLNAAERQTAVDILRGYLSDRSAIVKTFSMQALADLAQDDAALRTEVRALIEALTHTGTPAMRSRGRKLLKNITNRAGYTGPAFRRQKMEESSRNDIRRLLKSFGINADEMLLAHLTRYPGEQPLRLRLTLTDLTDYGDNPPAEPLSLEVEGEIRR